MKRIITSILGALLFLMIMAPPVYATTVIDQNVKFAACPPSNMQILPSKGAMLKDGENMRILLIPVEKTNSVSLIIARRQQMDFLELDRETLPESESEIVLSTLARDGSLLVAIVRKCGDDFYFSSFESVMRSRDVQV